MGKIVIGKPYIWKGETKLNKEAVRICAEIEMKNPNTKVVEKKVLYYEFDDVYTDAICCSRVDAFVVGLLTTAMENGDDIVFESLMSERLYYQLVTNYIPMITKYNSTKLNSIKLTGKLSNQTIINEMGVATGCSGGVDSFYTILRHQKENTQKNYALTHIIFSSCGTLDCRTELIEKYYLDQMPVMSELANEFGCEIIGCYTNLHEFYRFPYDGFCNFYTTIYGSVAFALQKLLSVYYVNSGDPVTEFNIDIIKSNGYDGSIIDIFTVGCICSENLTFYSTGAELTRLEKERYIAHNIVAQKYLTVCGMEVEGGTTGGKKNCSRCPKCLRTMVQLYCLGELDSFNNVFDVDDFNKHKIKRIGKMLGTSKLSYVKDTLREARKNKVKIRIRSKLLIYLWYRPIKYACNILRNSIMIRKIYYKFNLDYKIYGYRASTYEVWKDKLNLK